MFMYDEGVRTSWRRSFKPCANILGSNGSNSSSTGIMLMCMCMRDYDQFHYISNINMFLYHYVQKILNSCFLFIFKILYVGWKRSNSPSSCSKVINQFSTRRWWLAPTSTFHVSNL